MEDSPQSVVWSIFRCRKIVCQDLGGRNLALHGSSLGDGVSPLHRRWSTSMRQVRFHASQEGGAASGQEPREGDAPAMGPVSRNCLGSAGLQDRDDGVAGRSQAQE